jgi:peptidoglycan/xylan/chitin deacetylase (PgdA/CDA1 family)
MSATILCYHKVGPEHEEGRRLNISPGRLESHVRFFARRGHPFKLGRDLGGAWPAGVVCFTFDDAYASTLANAIEPLERHGARATFYAVAGKIGERSSWDGNEAKVLASWEALAYAQLRGHEIGNHSMSHPHLANVAPEQLVREVADADRTMRTRGLLPGSFCYPYGSVSDAAVAAVRSTGYPVAMALEKRLAESSQDRLRLTRVVIAFSDTLPMLLYRLYVRPKMRKGPKIW